MKRITDENRWVGSNEYREDRDRKIFLTSLGVVVIIITAILGILLIVNNI